MKKSLLLLSMMLCMFTCVTAQTVTNKQITRKPDKQVNATGIDANIQYTKYDKNNSKDTDININYKMPVSYVTKNRDTLYLVNNELGKMISQVWTENKYKEHPVVLLVDVLPTKPVVKPASVKIPKNKNL